MSEKTNIKFIKYNGISGYARVMYHDVEDSDKYQIEVTYNGKDIKALLEYLFDTENEVKRLNNIINELEKWLENYIKLFDEPDILEEQTCEDLKEVLNKLQELKGSDKE